MRKIIGVVSSLLTAIFGVLLIILGTRTQVAIFVDGSPTVFHTHALTVGNALSSGGITFSSSDRVIPSVGSFLPADGIIQVHKTHRIEVIVEPGGTTLEVNSSELIPGNLLIKAGIQLFPEDRILFNGEQIDPSIALPFATAYTLQIRRSQPVTIAKDGSDRTFYSSAYTIGQALSENGILPGLNDELSIPPSTSLNGPMAIEIREARLVEIEVGGKIYFFHSRASTVGDALAQAGVSLQYLDMATPPEDAPLPDDGKIKITSVTEQLTFQEFTTPFGTKYISDPDTELGQTSVVTLGQYGVSISRQRVAYADGAEISHVSDAAWQVSQPVDQQVGTGTKIEIRSLDTPNGPVEYWRTATVYVTSYSPCRSAADRCYTGTSSGMKAGYGVVASTLAWYRSMKYQRFYIPGYGVGTLADVGGGFPDGRHWIDLGYDDSNYVQWGQWITIYFLTPVPAWYPEILP